MMLKISGCCDKAIHCYIGARWRVDNLYSALLPIEILGKDTVD